LKLQEKLDRETGQRIYLYKQGVFWTAAFASIVIFLMSCSGVHAQSIQLHFPHFAGHQYDWKIFQGEKDLAVRSGEIPPDGRVTLTMPEAYKEYRGMTRWLLKKGGGLDMIYVGKGFSVECLSEQPGPETIIYTGNPENDFLAAQHRRQQAVLDRLGAVNHLLQVYSPDEDLHRIALKEQENLRRQFEEIQSDRAKSPSYAARLGEIVDFTRGVADKVYENQGDHIGYFNNFVAHALNFDDLYTSGHWDQVLHNWLMMNISSKDGDASFKERLDAALSRINRDDIVGAFMQKAVPFLVQKGKDDLLPWIASHLDKHPDARAKLPDNVKNMISSFKILTGKKAPDIVLKAPVRTQTGRSAEDITLETGKLNSDYTILMFYQGECPLCEDALIDLANKYKWLAEHKVRVIAVSGDTTEQGFEKKLNYHQWPDNYCDFTGMTGVNFKNYGVLGIPTLFLLDKGGIVLEKTATVEEVTKILSFPGRRV
jgi:peroxiredoxin